MIGNAAKENRPCQVLSVLLDGRKLNHCASRSEIYDLTRHHNETMERKGTGVPKIGAARTEVVGFPTRVAAIEFVYSSNGELSS